MVQIVQIACFRAKHKQRWIEHMALDVNTCRPPDSGLRGELLDAVNDEEEEDEEGELPPCGRNSVSFLSFRSTCLLFITPAEKERQREGQNTLQDEVLCSRPLVSKTDKQRDTTMFSLKQTGLLNPYTHTLLER